MSIPVVASNPHERTKNKEEFWLSYGEYKLLRHGYHKPNKLILKLFKKYIVGGYVPNETQAKRYVIFQYTYKVMFEKLFIDFYYKVLDFLVVYSGLSSVIALLLGKRGYKGKRPLLETLVINTSWGNNRLLKLAQKSKFNYWE